jgi:hypothetical protein
VSSREATTETTVTLFFSVCSAAATNS